MKTVPTFPFSLTFQVMVSAYMFLCAFQEWSVFSRTVHVGAPLRKTLPTAGTSVLTRQKSSYRALQVACPETIRIDVDIFNKLSGLLSCEHAGT